MCQCSCKGWCTYWPLLHALQWDLNTLAQNCRPLLSHDGTPFVDGTDMHRQAGQEYGFCAPVIQVRGGWPPVAKFLCHRIWAHAIHPCLLCHIHKHQFQDLSMYNVSLNEAPWALFDAQGHVAEVARHVIQVRIESVDVRSMVLQALRHSGPAGSRYVYKDIVTLSLKAGDRLEP